MCIRDPRASTEVDPIDIESLSILADSTMRHTCDVDPRREPRASSVVAGTRRVRARARHRDGTLRDQRLERAAISCGRADAWLHGPRCFAAGTRLSIGRANGDM
jgi:hypothetical protein